MKISKAFFAGVAGGLAMSLLMALARLLIGMPANLEMMLGTMIVQTPGPAAWIAGLILHLAISGGIALIYASVFEYVAHRSGWLLGGGLAVVHALLAGAFMGMMPAMHPMIPEMMAPPGAFMSSLGGMGIATEFILHIVYGMIVGALYGPVRHSPRISQKPLPVGAH